MHRAVAPWASLAALFVAACDLEVGLGSSPPPVSPLVRPMDAAVDDAALDAGVDAADAHDHATDHDTGPIVDAGPRPDLGPIPFLPVYKTIIRERCGCHSSAPFLGGLDMRSELIAYENLLGMPPGSSTATSSECEETGRARVVPGNPGASLLWQKLQAFDDHLRCGARMPQGGSPIPPDELELVTLWIRDGALP
ncbi:MAG: hypothetical protein IT379_18555 [Deltaproteobacteria bacterium]|nr:hypothetical protein [Deltaproteobacteria bacterium]